MASIKTEANPFSKAPFINITNVTFPLQKEPTPYETPQSQTQPDRDTNTPAVFVTLSDEAHTALAEDEATNASDQTIEPNLQAIDGEPVEVPIALDESEDNTATDDDGASGFNQLRTDIASVFDNVRLSRPERAVLNRALESTNLSVSSTTDEGRDQVLPRGLANGNGRAIGIERRLINLLQNNLNLPDNTDTDFNSLTSFLDSLIARINENTSPTDNTDEEKGGEDRSGEEIIQQQF
jgi:hypothetical protein